ncbi:hypothetical protein ACIG56_22450 [Nocardia fusca]
MIDRGALDEVTELFADAVYGRCAGAGAPIGELIVSDARAVPADSNAPLP